jgi:hypothetical protein
VWLLTSCVNSHFRNSQITKKKKEKITVTIIVLVVSLYTLIIIMTTPFTLLDESSDISWLRRRPTPMEDTVTYKLWFNKERAVDLAAMEQLAIEIAGQLLVYCKDYIWQKEPFRLTAKQGIQYIIYLYDIIERY